jgi:uncharacterized protein YjaZ
MKPRFKNKDTPSKVEKLLRKAIKSAHKKLEELGLNSDGVRSMVYVDDVVSRKSLQNQLGVTAMVFDDDRFKIAIDRNRIDDPQVLKNFKSLIVHESNHLDLMRLNGDDPRTLAEVLVSEGFAQVAEQEAGFSKPLGEGLLNSQQMAHFETEVKPYLEDDLFTDVRPKKDFDYWFGEKGASLTGSFNASSGYALGLHIVRGFMNDHDLSMGQAMQKPASEIIGHWQDQKM